MLNLNEDTIQSIKHHKFFGSTSILGLDKVKVSALKRLGIESVGDLLLYKPSYYQKRRIFPDLKSLFNGEFVVIKAEVKEVLYPARKNQPIKIYIENETGGVTIAFFKLHNYLKTIFKIGNRITVSGKVELYDYRPQINHPEVIYDFALLTENEPVYSLTYGITNSMIRKYILKAISYIGEMPEWLDQKIIKDYGLPNFLDAIKKIHGGMIDISIQQSMLRLKIDEAIANQLGFRYIKDELTSIKGRKFDVDYQLKKTIIERLGFELTDDQEKAIREIEKDQLSDRQMLRMVQGDVGCGKTIVAMLTALNVISSKSQVAIMVPTEVLARQHYLSACKLFEDIGINISLLTGKMPLKEKKGILLKIESGEVDLVIGTHSLFQESVVFKDLGYVIVDEQHRFGVAQRMDLASKGKHPDILIMSATPIPRSLSLTMFGDLSLTMIKSMPRLRKQVKTFVAAISKIDDVVKALHSVIERGEKTFWICPLIEKEEEGDFIDVERRFTFLAKLFDKKVGFLHGLMSGAEKAEIIDALKDGRIQILVSTTVIEVGIDITDATMMIIENAEKFGLAQMHQLRGRVGRGDKESTCILLYGKRVSSVAFERFKIMKESCDGFLIAEKDLALRGEGELLGARQSGEQSFRFLDLSIDGEIINNCHIYSQNLLIDNDRLLQMFIYNRNLISGKVTA